MIKTGLPPIGRPASDTMALQCAQPLRARCVPAPRMALAALIFAVVALLVALTAVARAGSKEGAVEAARSEARRVASSLEADLRAEIETTRRLLAEVAGGAELSAEAILDGQLWRDVDEREAAALIEDASVFVLDVRTPDELRSGVLPRASSIPIDELDARKRELPRTGRILVYCASGGRSAAVCEALSRDGRSGMLNLTGGIGAWRGPVVHD